MRARFRDLFDSPFLRRVAWHVSRVTEKIDRRFFTALMTGLIVILGLAALAVWLGETNRDLEDLGASAHWSLTTVLGQGDASFVTGPVGWVVGWVLGLFGVAIVAALTGALVGFVIDFLLKEGQGMGAAGYRGHIVVCGWNATARDLIEELSSDDYDAQLVLLHEAERTPVKDSVYFVRGSISDEADLRRAGIEHAVAAIVCPDDGSDQADMRSILAVLAIEHMAPHVRTVVEVNNPAHVPHFRRANVDELLVTSQIASRLLARSAMYPGLSELVTDIVSGGAGSELYRVALPEESVGKPIDELSSMLRERHGATLLAVSRDGVTFTNPGADFHLARGDNLVVIAETLGDLEPLRNASALA
jgi:voltage-gated potassium channel